jgi:hypothetical protein
MDLNGSNLSNLNGSGKKNNQSQSFVETMRLQDFPRFRGEIPIYSWLSNVFHMFSTIFHPLVAPFVHTSRSGFPSIAQDHSRIRGVKELENSFEE